MKTEDKLLKTDLDLVQLMADHFEKVDNLQLLSPNRLEATLKKEVKNELNKNTQVSSSINKYQIGKPQMF